jgi:hypothetical protein
MRWVCSSVPRIANRLVRLIKYTLHTDLRIIIRVYTNLVRIAVFSSRAFGIVTKAAFPVLADIVHTGFLDARIILPLQKAIVIYLTTQIPIDYLTCIFRVCAVCGTILTACRRSFATIAFSIAASITIQAI